VDQVAVLRKIAEKFQFEGDFQKAHSYGNGHINDTYLLHFVHQNSPKQYILQRVNTHVFRDPEHLMQNMSCVTAHIRQKVRQAGGDIKREVLNTVKTRTGADWFVDDEGGFWRASLFIGGVDAFSKAEHPEHLFEAARAFGRFQRQLCDFPADTLFPTIPDFHNTAKRFHVFQAALAADVCGRAAAVQPEIDFLLARAADMSVLVDALDRGELPLRVTHNDTKLNNVLIDKQTGKGLCVIDLDTVMPGLSLYDFGDGIRSGTNTGEEDDQDLSGVCFSLPLFERYTEGYLSEAGDSLTPAELALLPFSAKLMTLECGMRFLTDYLQGDVYFKVHRPDHNLDRCRTQFKLVADMERAAEQMAAIVARCTEHPSKQQS